MLYEILIGVMYNMKFFPCLHLCGAISFIHLMMADGDDFEESFQKLNVLEIMPRR